MEMLRKVVNSEPKEIAERTLEFVGSSENKDRDGDTIRAEGWVLRNFRANPVFMWGHDYNSPPIGRANKVWVDKEAKELRFHIEFVPKEISEFADTIYKLYKGGYLKATSVGFIPHDWEGKTDADISPNWGNNVFVKQELLELSAVPVPSNPDALVQARGLGIISQKQFLAITKPEETEDYIRIPVPGEEGKHDGHRIRTIDIDADKGITALYCGECRVIITYLFSKEDDWTMESAQDWVDEHEKMADIPQQADISQAEIKDELDYTQSLIKEGDLSSENIEIAWNIVREVLGLPGSHIPEDILGKIGAVLSTKNKGKLRSAQGLIQEVLDSSDTKPEEEAISMEDIIAATQEVFRAELRQVKQK